MVLVAGCSTLPTAPLVPAPQSNDTEVSSDSSPELLGGIVGGVGGIVGEVIPPVIPPIGTVLDTVIRSLPIHNGVGGAVENGKFLVTIPTGAIRGDAEVKVIVPDSTQLRCFLEITPPEANGFEIPVTLSINPVGQAHPERLGIAWFNPATREWEPVDSQFNPATGRVEAQLPHFSEYRVQEALRSKAGW
jgi:hypothetical protein